MIRSRKLAFLAALALSAAIVFGLPVKSQAQTVASQSSPAKKLVKSRFEVLRMMYTAIQVRNPSNLREIRTFTYSDPIRDKMQTLFNEGGFQYGDKVEIWYEEGGEVALKIKGKPSKHP
jgi:hypothetical protein